MRDAITTMLTQNSDLEKLGLDLGEGQYNALFIFQAIEKGNS